MKIRIKAQDGFIRVSSLDEEHQKLLRDNKIFASYVSTNNSKYKSAVVEELAHGKQPLSYSKIISRFKQESDPVFKYLSGLSKRDLWIEINRNKEGSSDHPVSSHERAKRYNLGLVRFSYHHVGNSNSNEEILNKLDRSNTFEYFFYRSLDDLVNDIKRKVMKNE